MVTGFSMVTVLLIDVSVSFNVHANAAFLKLLRKLAQLLLVLLLFARCCSHRALL